MFSKIWLLSNDPWSLMRWSLRSSSKRGNDGYYISVAIFIGIKCIGKIFYCMPPICILTSNYPEKYWERHKIFTMCNIEAYHHNKWDIDISLYTITNICNQLYAFPLWLRVTHSLLEALWQWKIYVSSVSSSLLYPSFIFLPINFANKIWVLQKWTGSG